ncbi:MAG: hypothetical protein OXT74_19330, partial [Candidatus Poribacteria bacterium]|nr:hypothetical protein [Candidatus Poribacteria bacterium]
LTTSGIWFFGLYKVARNFKDDIKTDISKDIENAKLELQKQLVSLQKDRNHHESRIDKLEKRHVNPYDF